MASTITGCNGEPMKPLLILAILTMPMVAAAQAQVTESRNSKGGGTSGLIFDGAIGYSEVTLKNPSGSDATYRGPSLQGRAHARLLGTSALNFWNLDGVLRYMDLANRYNNDSQVETANMLGPGIGTTFGLGGFFLGAEYLLMWARHYAVGPISNRLTYSFSMFNAVAGFRRDIGQEVQIALSGSYGFGTVSGAQYGAKSNSAYSDTSVWIQAILSTDINPFRFFSGGKQR